MPINIDFFIQIVERCDPQVFTPLDPHINKSFEIRLLDLNASIFFIVQNQSLRTIQPVEQPDLVISGNSLPIVSLLCKRTAKVQILGDTTLLSALDRCIQNMDLDFEGLLASFIGDFAAVSLTKQIHHLTKWIKPWARARIRDVPLFLQEETTLLPRPHELHAFYSEVDALKEKLERLEARYASL